MSEAVLYGAAGAAYVVLGIFVPEVLFSWLEGAAFLLIAVVLVPRMLRRLG
jgi:hypothetical protein